MRLKPIQCNIWLWLDLKFSKFSIKWLQLKENPFQNLTKTESSDITTCVNRFFFAQPDVPGKPAVYYLTEIGPFVIKIRLWEWNLKPYTCVLKSCELTLKICVHSWSCGILNRSVSVFMLWIYRCFKPVQRNTLSTFSFSMNLNWKNFHPWDIFQKLTPPECNSICKYYKNTAEVSKLSPLSCWSLWGAIKDFCLPKDHYTPILCFFNWSECELRCMRAFWSLKT